MDTATPTARREIAQRAALVAAVRLPTSAAGTRVVTDLLVLPSPAAGELYLHGRRRRWRRCTAEPARSSPARAGPRRATPPERRCRTADLDSVSPGTLFTCRATLHRRRGKDRPGLVDLRSIQATL